MGSRSGDEEEAEEGGDSDVVVPGGGRPSLWSAMVGGPPEEVSCSILGAWEVSPFEANIRSSELDPMLGDR
jgi:hypothetical protein